MGSALARNGALVTGREELVGQNEDVRERIDDGDSGVASNAVVRLDAELVRAYWTYWRLSSSAERIDRLESSKCFWAWEAVQTAALERTDGIVSLVVALADAAGGDVQKLAFLGAGPIEDFLRHGQDPVVQILDELHDAACRNEGVRLAVRGVWWGDDDDPLLVARFIRFGPTY